MKLVIIGAGIIGGSWAISALRAGHDVILHDPVMSEDDLTQRVEAIRREVSCVCLETPPGELLVENAIAKLASYNADYVQEAIIEDLEKKKELFRQLDEVFPPSVTIASSSSALTATKLMGELRYRERCLIAHPATPPHLLPAVEVVPACFTSPATVAHTNYVLQSMGQKPVEVYKEIDGFVMNRLQAALLIEMLALIRDGVVSPDGADTLIRDAFGMRWSVLGPLEGVHLNAPGGVYDYFLRYSEMFQGLIDNPLPRHDLLSEEVIRKISLYCEKTTKISDITDRREWRDKQFEKILNMRKEVGKE